MGLLDFIFGKKEPEPEPDVLLTTVVPKKTFKDYSYRHPNSTIKEPGEYFDACADGLLRIINEEYGIQEYVKEPVNKSVRYRFEGKGTEIDYMIMSLLNCTDGDGKEFSMAMTAMLQIKQVSMDMDKAGRLMRFMDEHHLFDYKEEVDYKFGTFLKLGGKDYNGVEVMHMVGLAPVEVAKYWTVMFYGGYNVHTIPIEVRKAIYPWRDIQDIKNDQGTLESVESYDPRIS